MLYAEFLMFLSAAITNGFSITKSNLPVKFHFMRLFN